MGEVIDASLTLYNLPFTLMLGFVVFYWVVVIIGVVDAESLDFDFELEGDVDLDVDADVPFLHQALHFLHVGEVPLMVVLSIASLIGWIIAVLGNHHLNGGDSYLIAAGIFVVNIVVTILITAIVGKPIGKLFSIFYKDYDSQNLGMGDVGIVTTKEVTNTFGQVEFEGKGSPIVVNARTKGDLVLTKGQKALVLERDAENGTYIVDDYSNEMEI